MVEHDLLAEADDEVADADRNGLARRAIHRLHSDRGEEDGEEAVEHDDEENRFDDRCRRLQAEQFGAALDPQALAQATTPMTSAMKGALIMPTSKCVTEIASCSRAMKIGGLMPP